MAHHWSDNVLTTAFTPRDYQVELLAAAREKNIIICLGHNSSKEFIALKLIHELGIQLRNTEIRKVTLYLSNNLNSESAFNLIYHLTDLKVINLNQTDPNLIEWETLASDYQVIILSIESCLNALICMYLDLNFVNLVVIEDCHKNYGKLELKDLFDQFYEECLDKPKILGLAGPLHNAGCAPGRLGAELEQLEKSLRAKAETASDIVTVLRYCSKPIELILQCAPPHKNYVTEFLRNLVLTKKAFISDHRFDPSEIYEGFQDEIKAIPDPKQEPIRFLDEYLEVLEELGAWSSDRAALSLLVQIEKFKVKTPYERHFLLLCLVSTTFVQIRAHCDYIFQKLSNEKERIETYSTPKVLRLLETLKQFKPEIRESIDSNYSILKLDLNTNKPKDITPRNVKNLEQIEKLDFKKLNDSVDKITENITNSEQKDVNEIKTALNKLIISEDKSVSNNKSPNSPTRSIKRRYRPRHHHIPGAPYSHRRFHSSYFQNESDALCGIIFCNSKFFAKILFSLLCEMTRNDDNFKFLNVQYTVDKEADPLVDLKEAETEHRKQEEVLKRFRMHECNLLIGTSVLEEGIDLPKCNLVVRWDTPVTYRSYVQCKGRARAAHAYHIIMVAPKIRANEIINDVDGISNKIHKFACFPGKIDELKFNEMIDDGNDIDGNSVSSSSTSSSSNVDSGIHGSTNLNSEDNETKVIADEKNDIDEDNIVVNNTNKLNDKFICCAMNVEDETDKINLNKNSVNEQEQEFDNLKVESYIKMINTTNEMIERLAQYKNIEKMLLRKCENIEPYEEELQHADNFTTCIQVYRPLKDIQNSASVSLATAVSLVNKYCAKLPSDTFTKLTPLWRLAKTKRNSTDLYQCTLRLPINSPLKEDIIGLPMISRILARRVSALVACKILHKTGELDDNLQPIGKENFRANEPDWENFELEDEDEQIVSANTEPRPGTTKRRQYYYKRIASTFSKCRPNAGEKSYLYHISMILTCPIPEEQNTRGRKIYPPEESPQGFGILTTKRIPKVSSFPIFTRSGEVKVSLELAKDNVIFNEDQLTKIYTFINYTFTNVLRLQKYLMLFDPEATENSFFIVPTIKNEENILNVDWNFLNLINDNVDKMPKEVPEMNRKIQEFDPNKFKDAVVMPWYRNQDQPQYFYVAEICYHLSPNSSFPGENYSTFQEYYFRKYSIEIQNKKQPLLDVDHTSARLNFLTPRYVNRKGVALPTSSEETKRAKRENLEQKQILVPELCTIHPFPASLWRAAVCLPCILYRINALLLADEIRKQVSQDLGLGKTNIIYDHFDWPTLDFGWSLADVLKKSREARLISGNLEIKGADNHQMAEIKKSTNIEDDYDYNSEKNENEKENDDEKQKIKEDKCNVTDNQKTANDILEEAELKERKLKSANVLEIGIWSNEMAENIPEDDLMDTNKWSLPPNINICSRNNTKIRYGSPTSWDVDVKENYIENYFSDSDISYQSDEEFDNSSASTNEKLTGLRIEFKSDNVAEAIETEEEILKREKQLAIINDRNINERHYQNTKNICSGYDCFRNTIDEENTIKWHETQFESSTKKLQEDIKTSGMLVKYNQKLEINPRKSSEIITHQPVSLQQFIELFPFIDLEILDEFILNKSKNLSSIQLTIDDLYEINKLYLKPKNTENYYIEGTGDMFDNFNDNFMLHMNNLNGMKETTIDFMEKEYKINKHPLPPSSIEDILILNGRCDSRTDSFSFDHQPNLNGHPGPSPSIILQALTMSNANDGINLERLETIGDSFLKYAITTYLYCSYENVHEGKLSHLRSKQVSNLNLYRLGRRKILGESMIATKFEPHDNWLPPCYYVPRELEKALIEAKIPACYWHLAELPNLKQLTSDEICTLVKEKAESMGLLDDLDELSHDPNNTNPNGLVNLDNYPCFIPYNLVTQHSIPDKSIADCVEALIGAYLIECGPRGALLFMAWLGIRVLPITEIEYNPTNERIPGSTQCYSKQNNDKLYQSVYGHWVAPKSPLLEFAPNADIGLERLLDGYSTFENAIGYNFIDRSYLLQAMTHASYSPNRLTDCYQRLEFLGDAVLDYLITRHLYEDPRQHSPGALTDLRSALVNNTIFASLAVRHGFHKYFRHLSPALNEVIDRFVRIQHENGHSISEEYYLLSEEECDEAEDVEVPKALGDVFESVAGAIFLDSNMSLDTVWKIYSNMMKPEIEQFSNSVPKSPIRELLELEPETAKFGKPEKLADGRRVRVTVEVFGKGTFRGIGRNYRIAKCTAAKCALRQLKKQGLISKKH